tara:strand:+ start:1259 stop:1609 length:351 start_codon:yes stop_codon:yes gene_type:complete
MAGNYGGSSIPTTPITGAALLTGKNTTYKNYMCTTAVGGDSFVYKGVSITTSSDVPIEMVISPPLLGSQTGGVVFLCYDCSCDTVMTGITTSSINSGTVSRQFQHPTIIGGGGLNS